VYDRDPAVDATAKRFERLTYIEVLQRNLKVMDSTAISMCMESTAHHRFEFAQAG